jgi:soluble cytochrome b562
MKKTLLSVALFATTVMALTSCDEIAKELMQPFDVPVSNVTLTIPIVTNITAEGSLGSTTTSFNMDSAIKANTANAFSINAANSIKISAVTLNITNADATNNISNFESARVAFNTNKNTTQTTIGSKAILDNNTATNTSTTIDITNSPELKDYLNGSTTMTYTLFAKARRVTTHTLNAVINVTLHVE